VSERVVRRAVEAFNAHDLDGILAVADFPDWSPRPRAASFDEDGSVVIGLDVTATGAGSGARVDQLFWLGARVEAAKIIFFGFFRTEEDALDAVTSPPT
jgi:hypothetical protein